MYECRFGNSDAALNYGPIGNGATNACARELLAAGADVNAADQYGCNALMYAAMYGKRSLSPLLEAGADVHAADTDGFTPMLYACRLGCMQNVMLLYQHGADPHEVNADGTTALMLACEGATLGATLGATWTSCGGSSTITSTLTRCSTGTKARPRSPSAQVTSSGCS